MLTYMHIYTRWFKYDRDLCGLFTHKSVPVIFEPPCIHTYIHTYMHAYIHTYIHTYILTHTYIHTYIQTYIHTYIHTLNKEFSSVC